MKKILFVLAMMLTVTELAQAQGSPYNLIGFGTPVIGADPITAALAGSGEALEGTRTINGVNPADWTWLNRTRFETSLRYEYNQMQFGDATGSVHNVHFSGFTFGAPFYNPVNAVLAAGYLPLTNASTEITLVDSLGTRTYRSRGGANVAFLGFAVRPWTMLSLGARLDLITGDIKHEDYVVFNDASVQPSTFERDYFFHGLRPTIGMQFIGDSMNVHGLTVGASFSPSTTLSSTRESIFTPTSGVDTTIGVDGDGKYPMAFAVGASMRFGNRYRAMADYFAQDFTNALVFGTAGSSDPNGAASSRISVGLERVANVGGEFGSSYGMDTWALRLGFYYSTLPVAPAGSNGVNEMAITAGLGIPVGLESMLNFSVEGGQRTPVVSNSAPKETFVRLGASISLSERWFIPTRRD